ncbi:MAG TPA: dihydrofolate reductase family protein [Candidatus Merdivicinus excrementipullorum]|uniref:Dihydrofolate reductase family protein n=1 Tax=Candidatus Merdivicinus excrementipullorum TaxID=2840867 RepID=A0A9D1FLQ5_9FIRM|nr:dihydrofolate reductase family protein [Candidatus Merdivicinus excrementipullorum]
MKKPYTVCHMMTSIDGRIDCAMTAQLAGVEEYYAALEELDLPSTLSGRVTAQLEMSLPGVFQTQKNEPFGQEGFSKKAAAKGYEIIADTRGTLLWEEDIDAAKPHLIITSESVSREYLDYLDERHISWIACGKGRIDLKRAVEILAEEFGAERLGIVGGPAINSAFLEAGLLDEISILIGLGIDGRKGMPAVFDGFPMEKTPTPLKLKEAKTYQNGAVWLRYLV